MGWQDAPLVEATGRNRWEDAPLVEVPPPPPSPEEPGFMSRVATDIGKRASGVATAFTEPIQSMTQPEKEAGYLEAIPQRLLRAGGQAVATVGDIAGEAAKGLYRTVTPEPVQEGISSAGKSILDTKAGQTALRALQAGGQVYGKFKASYPELAKDVEAAANIAFNAPMAKSLKDVGMAAGRAVTKIPTKAQAIMDLADEHNIPVSYGDITKGTIAPKVETGLESLPGAGMGKFRVKQNIAAQEAAQKAVEKFKVEGDWPELAQKGISVKATATKKAASRLYDDLAKRADVAGDVNPSKTMAVLDDLIAKESKAKIPDSSVLKMMGDVKEALKGKQKVITSPILDEYGKPMVTKVINLTDNKFSNLRDFRSDLGLMVKDYYSGKNAIVGQKGVDVLQQIRNTIDDDMSSWAQQQGGDIYRKWRVADKFYKDRVIPFREQAILPRLIKETDPDALYRTFTSAVKDRPQTIYTALPEKSRAAVRYGMVQDAFETAMNENKSIFSPAKFAQALEKKRDAIGVFFNSKDKAYVRGLEKLMRHVERSGQYMENPPTGQRVIPYLLGGAAVAQPQAVAAAVGGGFSLKSLLTTDAGKNFLLRASSLDIGSGSMNRLWQDLSKAGTLGKLGKTTGLAVGAKAAGPLPELTPTPETSDPLGIR